MIQKSVLLLQVFFILVFLKLRLSSSNLKGLLVTISKERNKFLFNGDLKRNGKAINICANIIPNCTCLIRSSAFKVISSGTSRITTLHIGIKKEGKLKSHAWIEEDNKVIFGYIENISSYKLLLKQD